MKKFSLKQVMAVMDLVLCAGRTAIEAAHYEHGYMAVSVVARHVHDLIRLVDPYPLTLQPLSSPEVGQADAATRLAELCVAMYTPTSERPSTPLVMLDELQLEIERLRVEHEIGKNKLKKVKGKKKKKKKKKSPTDSSES